MTGTADPNASTQPGEPASAKTDPEPRPLSPIKALKHALAGDDIDHYPRILDGDVPTLLPTEKVMRAFGEAAAAWSNLPDDNLDDAIKLARQSLDEVKDQTEYQDQKATRLLTVTTFLTALSGVLFTRMNDGYPLQSLSERPWCAIVLVLISYALFSVFLLASLCGALITFHATRTRFKYVAESDIARSSGLVKSRLFFRTIVSVDPKVWADGFVGTKDGKPAVRADLKQLYLRDLVGETYLVAAKTADKLRYLDPAQRLLALSLAVLLAWLVWLPVMGVFVTASTPRPLKIEVVPNPTPTPSPSATASPSPSASATTRPAATATRSSTSSTPLPVTSPTAKPVTRSTTALPDAQPALNTAAGTKAPTS